MNKYSDKTLQITAVFALHDNIPCDTLSPGM